VSLTKAIKYQMIDDMPFLWGKMGIGHSRVPPRSKVDGSTSNVQNDGYVRQQG